MVNLLKSITVYILLLAFLLIIANCGGESAEKIKDTTDTTPPDTSITSQPLNLTNSTSADFSFTSTEDGSTFECQMDNGSYTSCTSPKSYTGLTESSHSFSVKAIDSSGNADSTPASYTWAIDTTAVEISITSQPLNLTNSTSADFSFTSTEDGSTFECQMDSGGYTSCTSPKSYTGLTEGSHTFYVKATDSAGNTNSTPASYTWTIDTTPPTVSSTSSLTGVTLSTSITATFSETMDSSTITTTTFTLKDSDNNAVTGIVTYSGTTATWTPSSNLTSGTTYTATITTSVKDAAGNNMTSDKTWSFTTLGILTWVAPTKNLDGTDLTDLAGYKVYYGTSSGNYTTPIDVGNVITYGVKTLSAGTTYYFTVTAYNTIGNESDYATEVSKTIQ